MQLRKIYASVVMLFLLIVEIWIPVSAKGSESESRETYDYVLTETDVYETSEESEYNFCFEQTIEVEGITYILDHIEYNTVNRYEDKFGTEEPAYEIIREVPEITDMERETFNPSETSIHEEYTYEYSGVEFIKMEKTDSVKMTSYSDTDIVNGNFNPDEYPQTVEYVYEDGKSYTLSYSSYEKLEEGWYGGYVFFGRITHYDASTYMLGQYEIAKDEFNDINLDAECLNNVLHETGFSDLYRATTAHFDGDAYVENGITYRNYCIEGDAYGAKYRIYYEDTVEFPLYTAVMTYTMSEQEQEEIEELKRTYEVTANAFYKKKPAQVKEKGLSVTQKIVLGTGIIVGILIIAALILYLVKGGRKPTDHKSKRDVKQDYKNL